MRLGWKPSFPHPPWERHHPLGSKAQMQRLNGGRWVDQTHHQVVKDRNPISCIHVTLVPGHEFPINCGSQHGWKNSFRFQAGLEPGTLCFSIMVLDHPTMPAWKGQVRWTEILGTEKQFPIRLCVSVCSVYWQFRYERDAPKEKWSKLHQKIVKIQNSWSITYVASWFHSSPSCRWRRSWLGSCHSSWPHI